MKITIHNGKNKQSICIQGLRVDTSQAHILISDIFRHVEVATVKKLQEALIAKWIPKGATVTGLDARLVSFISTSSSSQRLMDDKMAEVYATVEWDTYSDTSRTIELTCTVTHSMTNAQQLGKTWNKDAPMAFLDVLKKEFASEEVSILQQAWETFVNCITYTEDQDRDKVVADVDANALTVHVTGQRKEVHYLSDRFKRDHSHIQEELNQLGTLVSDKTCEKARG